MKTVFARVITALVMIAGFTSCIWAGSKGEHVTEKRHVADFTSIDIKSVGSVFVYDRRGREPGKEYYN